jgi:hypothetical protein
MVWWLVGAVRALGEDVIIASSVSDEEAKGLRGQRKAPAFRKSAGRTQTELNPHVSDLRLLPEVRPTPMVNCLVRP